METEKTPSSQSNLEKEEWSWRNEVTWFQTITDTESSDSIVLAQSADQWSKVGSPETHPHTRGHLVLDKGGKNTQWGRDSLLNKRCWKNWTSMCKRMKLEHFLTLYTKINPKWSKDLNVRPETIKLLEENIGRILFDINYSKILNDPPSRVMKIKTKINKWDLNKLQSFCTAMETITRWKRQPSKWEKIIASETIDKRLISKIF